MNELIYGVWVSKNMNGVECNRYIFMPGNTFEFATKNGNEWFTSSQGTFTYQNQNVVLYFNGQTEELGYWGVNECELIQGFKCNGTNHFVEGDWVIDCKMPLSKKQDLVLTEHLHLNLQNGIMNADLEYSFNSLGKSSEYTGTYEIKENEITFSGSSASTPFFSNGTKTIRIIENVLLLINEQTILSYFQRF